MSSRDWKKITESVQDFELPDIAGIDGGVIQIVLIVIIALWLFRKLKSLFFLFLFAVMVYYMIGYAG
jgi:hypothetical protein